jgi:hypothetical protein
MPPKVVLSPRQSALLAASTEIERFSRYLLGRPLRRYQLSAARAIAGSLLAGRGLTLAVMMARQAGKNEVSAHVEAFGLHLHRRRGGQVVKASPTFRPHAQNRLARLLSTFQKSHLPPAAREEGYAVRVGRARALFFSAAPTAQVVGATANILLEADEAQDVDEDKWNKDFRPMGASANVTTVLWGTAWTPDTLLARSIRALRWAEERDGQPRVFIVPWEQVAAELPAYGAYVRGEIERLGRDHPLIRTQYDLQEIDSTGGMFPAATRALMQSSHPRQRGPKMPGEYAILVDVAGPSEERLDGAHLRAAEPRKDSTAATIVQIYRDEPGLTRFRALDRHYWTGTPHHQLHGALTRLAELWHAAHVVVDATGVGAGLASFLAQTLGARLVPFTFTARSKSELGWGFMGICNSGRWSDYAADDTPETRQFWREVAAADFEIVPGPARQMRWGVADAAIHDDLLISAALCAVLDGPAAGPHLASQIVANPDPLAGGPSWA